MNEFLERIDALEFGWRDAIDVIVVALIIYNVLRLIRGTRAMQMAIGLLLLGAAYFIASGLDLLALETFTRGIIFYLPFAIIVLFQHEIRRALASFGRSPFLGFLFHRASESRFGEVVSAAKELARRKVGALIVIQRTQNLRMYIESGKQLDANISTELLLNIFTPNTPLHDGAVVIQGDRIASANTFLPLSTTADASSRYGTRHRAALGISEETDAFVVVVSEETGWISIAIDGFLFEKLDPTRLAEMMHQHVAADADVKR